MTCHGPCGAESGPARRTRSRARSKTGSVLLHAADFAARAERAGTGRLGRTLLVAVPYRVLSVGCPARRRNIELFNLGDKPIRFFAQIAAQAPESCPSSAKPLACFIPARQTRARIRPHQHACAPLALQVPKMSVRVELTTKTTSNQPLKTNFF